MNTIEDDKKISNDISTSINILNEKDEEFHNDITSNLNSTNLTNEKDEVKNNVKQRDDKDDKITLEDLTKIIDEPDEKEKESENEQKKDDNTIKKEGGHLSQDEMLENEFSIIKKQNLSKYLRENNQFKSSNIESEEESHNNIHPIEPIGRKLYKFVGRTLFLFLDKFENPLIIIGPHWPLYVCFCGIISLIMLIIYLTLWKYIGFVMRIIGYICYWTYFLSYTYCSLINPGYPKNNIGRNFGYPRDEYYFCSQCQFFIKKSNYAHHCLDCDICIENHDHHCPWTGHCIGKNNYYSFYIFIGSSLSIIIYLASAFCIGASAYN